MSKNEIDQAFIARLQAIVGDGSARAFAQKAGLSPSALRSYLAGISDPTRRVLIAIADAANVNVEWLVTGAGNMRSPAETKLDRELLQDLLHGYARSSQTASLDIEQMSRWVALRYPLIASGAATPEARGNMVQMALAELELSTGINRGDG